MCVGEYMSQFIVERIPRYRGDIPLAVQVKPGPRPNLRDRLYVMLTRALVSILGGCGVP